MKQSNRILAALVISALLLGALSACGQKEDKTDNEDITDTIASENSGDDSSLNADGIKTMEVTLTPPEGTEIYMTIGEDQVTRDEYNFYMKRVKTQYDKGFDSYWTNNPEVKDNVRNAALRYVQYNHAVISEATRRGILLTDSEKNKIMQDALTEIADYGSEDLFLDAIESNDETEWLYLYLCQLEKLEEKLQEAYIADGTILENDSNIQALFSTDQYIYCKLILMQISSETDITDKLSKMQSVKTQLTSGADFDALMSQYNDDTLGASGYLFCRGLWTDRNFEDICYQLPVGSYSDVLKTSYGYVIVKRCAKDDAVIANADFDELKSDYQSAAFRRAVEAVVGEMTVTYNDNCTPVAF